MTFMAEELLFHLFLPSDPCGSTLLGTPGSSGTCPVLAGGRVLAFLGIVREGLGSAKGPAAVLPVGALPWVLECSVGIITVI